jgi:hypothetical protein
MATADPRITQPVPGPCRNDERLGSERVLVVFGVVKQRVGGRALSHALT